MITRSIATMAPCIAGALLGFAGSVQSADESAAQVFASLPALPQHVHANCKSLGNIDRYEAAIHTLAKLDEQALQAKSAKDRDAQVQLRAQMKAQEPQRLKVQQEETAINLDFHKQENALLAKYGNNRGAMMNSAEHQKLLMDYQTRMQAAQKELPPEPQLPEQVEQQAQQKARADKIEKAKADIESDIEKKAQPLIAKYGTNADAMMKDPAFLRLMKEQDERTAAAEKSIPEVVSANEREARVLNLCNLYDHDRELDQKVQLASGTATQGNPPAYLADVRKCPVKHISGESQQGNAYDESCLRATAQKHQSEIDALGSDFLAGIRPDFERYKEAALACASAAEQVVGHKTEVWRAAEDVIRHEGDICTRAEQAVDPGNHISIAAPHK
ncbi:MAG TPA: hypothetical protein VHE81_00850 [Lacipirellulaceae bacterium]|nr:hypothetical protein [Lacipirellulaceae bacterium]